MGAGQRPLAVRYSVVAALLLGSASLARAQQAPELPPPQPDTTTVTDPPQKTDEEGPKK